MSYIGVSDGTGKSDRKSVAHLSGFRKWIASEHPWHWLMLFSTITIFGVIGGYLGTLIGFRNYLMWIGAGLGLPIGVGIFCQYESSYGIPKNLPKILLGIYLLTILVVFLLLAGLFSELHTTTKGYVQAITGSVWFSGVMVSAVLSEVLKD